jgi:signal transduction histidine kinase
MHTKPDKPRFQKVFFAMGGSIVGIFALAVLAGIGIFRAEARHQILQRDGILLGSITRYLFINQETTGIPEVDLLELAFETSEIDGIIAVRVFHPTDTLVQMVPESLYPVSLASPDRQALAEGMPVTRYFPSFRPDTLFSDIEEVDAGKTVPLVEVITPISGWKDEPMAAIQFWLDGSEMAAEFATLDRYLATIGIGFILGGGLIFSVVFLYARNRLIGMARVLAERNRSLERANTDLAIAARTSAIGSVTSHLFHDLKNPLAGLKAYLRVSSDNDEAVAVADRMQSLIDETLMMLREQESDRHVDLPMEEIVKMARKRLGVNSVSHPPEVRINASGDCRIPLHKVQMFLLILHNLVENARAASPRDKAVEVLLSGSDSALEATVEDAGPGLPAHVQSQLFEPVSSDKADGTGIGLAISSIIARHIPARLELLSTGPEGTRFQIHIPL